MDMPGGFAATWTDVPRASWSSSAHTIPPLPFPTLLGFGSPPRNGNSNGAHDPFDYERKYPPDEKGKELGPSARVWKMYEDESNKHDSEMISGWRESLDMLLIFASLFSAVVTTFVTQACQSLEADPIQLLTALVLESNHLKRAMAHWTEAVDAVPETDTNPSYRAKTSDVWVNTMWFTSLGLSLATALIAVMAKQWLHEYTSIPTGTYHDRARIRHYRFMALGKRRVPLIIELLPVLMHTSLGVFLLGLIIYLFSLLPRLAIDLGTIAGVCFLAYATSNTLPIFSAECPYKTPLSSHSFSLFTVLRRQIRLLTRLASGSYPDPHEKDSSDNDLHSLRDIELGIVNNLGDFIDACALAWLYNSTSNLTAQSVVLQSLCTIPLQSLEFLKRSVPDGIPSVLEAVNSHYFPDQSLERFERFQGTALRFRDDSNAHIDITTGCNKRSIYADIQDPIFAVELCKRSLTALDQGVKLDALLWGEIFSNALRLGTAWMGAEELRPSHVWLELLRVSIGFHDTCERLMCSDDSPAVQFPAVQPTPKPLYAFPAHEDEDGNELPRLTVTDYKIDTNATACDIATALRQNMFPSFVKLLIHIGYPGAVRSTADHTTNLPDDIFLLVLMARTPHIQATSSRHQIWYADNPDMLRKRRPLFRDVVRRLAEYAYYPDSISPRHRQYVPKASLYALQQLLGSQIFGAHMTILLEDEVMVVGNIFQTVNLHLVSDGANHDFSWLAPENATKALTVSLDNTQSDTYDVLGNLFSYLIHSGGHLRAIQMLYDALLERKWLQGLTVFMSDPSKSMESGYVGTSSDDRLHLWVPCTTAFMAALFVDGLSILASHAPEIYATVMDDLCDPCTGSLVALCEILLTADIDTQERLWGLTRMVQRAQWDPCLQSLKAFSESRRAQKMWTESNTMPPAGLGGKTTKYLPMTAMPFIVGSLTNDIRRHVYTPPRYPPQALIVNKLHQQVSNGGAAAALDAISRAVYYYGTKDAPAQIGK